MRYIFAVLILGFFGCRSSFETTERESRDTVIVYQPLPVDTVFIFSDVPSGILNPDCDTLAILARYADFDLVSADTFYTLLAKYTAKDRRLRVLESRPPDTRVVTIENIYKQTKIVKDSLWDRIKTAGVGAMVMFGLCLIAVVVLKLRGMV